MKQKTNGTIVCLLDDDPSLLRAMSRMLSSAGCEVQSFTDPIAFLDYAQDHRPRVAVLDILMPIMNGLEVQTRLRDLSPSTGVIVVTSKDDPLVRSKAMMPAQGPSFSSRSTRISFWRPSHPRSLTNESSVQVEGS